jgi:two-component system chemotaxis response regulator CheV
MALNHNILLESGTNEFEVVEFAIFSGEKKFHFCINVAKVQEVIRFPEVVQMPDAHEAIVGTANLRQHLVPIIDLARWLGIKRSTSHEDSKVIVTFFNHSFNGFMVDEVVRIHRVTWADIRDYASITDFSMVESVLGVIDIQDKMVQLLDFESIVGDINPDTKLHNAEIDMSLVKERGEFTVFFAEDSPVIRRLLLQQFTKAGYHVKPFENGHLLLHELTMGLPDLVITDLEMPVTSGDYVVKKIRETVPSSRLPIIVFSSMASEENERKLKGLGADKFIGKPDLGLLVSLVDGYLIKDKEKR